LEQGRKKRNWTRPDNARLGLRKKRRRDKTPPKGANRTVKGKMIGEEK